MADGCSTINQLEEMAEEVTREHLWRLSRPESVPIKRNPFKHRQRPKTAIIAQAALLLMAGAAHAGGLPAIADIVGRMAGDLNHRGVDGPARLVDQEPSFGPTGMQGLRCIYEYPDGRQRVVFEYSYCPLEAR